MDGTRDRLPERTVDTWGRSSARRSARRANAQPDGPARPIFAATAPVAAPDVLIDVGAPSVPAPVSAAPATVPAAEPARALAQPAPARVRRRKPLRAFAPVALGALGLVAAFAAAMLLRAQLAPDAAAALGAVAAEPAAAAAIVHLRVSAAFDPAERQRIAAALAEAGYRQVVVHEMPFSISTSRVGYFREDDRVSAEALLGTLSSLVDGLELRDYRTLVQVPEPGRLDLWIRS